MKRIEIIFCGNSVYLCGLAAALQQVEELRIRVIDTLLDKVSGELKMLFPDVLVAEAVQGKPELIGALLKDYPQMLIIEVQPETDSLAVFSNQQHLTTTIEDLPTIIKAYSVTRIHNYKSFTSKKFSIHRAKGRRRNEPITNPTSSCAARAKTLHDLLRWSDDV